MQWGAEGRERKQGGSVGKVSALFVCRSTHYAGLPGVDCWDESRDARNYPGPFPVVAHPPCRGWGRLRAFANVQPGELDLGRVAVDMVRRYGGVLEHPAGSKLWEACGLPAPGQRDAWGFTLGVRQSDFDHRAPKATFLYVCGVPSTWALPTIPIVLGEPEGRIEYMGRAERERTPPMFALWLVAIARKSGMYAAQGYAPAAAGRS